MILAEDELGARQRPQRDHAARPRPRRGRRSARCSCRWSTPCSLIEATGNRPDLQSIYGIAREIATLYGLPLSRRPGLGDSPRRAPSGQVAIRDRRLRRLPALHRPAVRRTSRSRPRRCGSAARLLAAGMRSDLERRRHHELRDARTRQPAARLRLDDARRRADHRSPRRAGREDAARSTASTVSSSPTTS